MPCIGNHQRSLQELCKPCPGRKSANLRTRAAGCTYLMHLCCPWLFQGDTNWGKVLGWEKAQSGHEQAIWKSRQVLERARKEVLYTAKRTRHLETNVGRTRNLSRQKMLWLNSEWFRALRSRAAPQGLQWKAEQCCIGSAHGAWLALSEIRWLIHTLKKEVYPGQLAQFKKKQATV